MTDLNPPLLLVTLHVIGGDAVVSVRGDLDASAAAELTEVTARILAAEPARVVFDMAHAGFLDCFAAGVIFAAVRSLPGGERLVIRSPRPVVRRLLEMTGLDAQCIIEERPPADLVSDFADSVPCPAARVTS